MPLQSHPFNALEDINHKRRVIENLNSFIQGRHEQTWNANFTFADSAELRLGTGGDFRLYHDGSDAYVRNDTGTLRFLMGSVEMARLTTGGNFSFSGMLASSAYTSVDGISIALESNSPVVWFRRNSSASNEKNWAMYAQSAAFGFFSYDDAGANPKDALKFDRSGNAITTVNFANATDNPVIRFLGTGNVRFGGTATGASTGTFTTANKPGANNGIIAWIPVLTSGGTQGYVPVVGA